MIWVAASGSVGDTIAPSVNAAAQGSPTSSWATTATATAVAATSPMAMSEMTRASRRTSRSDVKNAPT
jgi:hypothetical protein